MKRRVPCGGFRARRGVWGSGGFRRGVGVYAGDGGRKERVLRREIVRRSRVSLVPLFHLPGEISIDSNLGF